MSKLTDSLGEMILGARQRLRDLHDQDYKDPGTINPDKIRLAKIKLDELEQLQKDLSDDHRSGGNYSEK